MAYAALTSLPGVIHQILPHDQRYICICGKDQMNSLHEKVSLLQDFLEYILSRSFVPATDVLESRIRDTAYKMEDLIELFILSDPGKETESEVQLPTPTGGRIKRKKKKKNKRKEKSILTVLPTPDNFSSYFKDVLVLTEEAMEMKKTLDNNVIPLSNHPISSREAPSPKCTKVGLDDALNQILERVMQPRSMLRIIPITGMGGIGKTTLARASYEAPQTLNHFDVRLWITVSQDYNIQEILKGLLPEAKQDNERLIEHVHKYLTGRRYLIVLDDMWDEKVWDRERKAFPEDNKGSRVILTTRLSGVASYVGSSSPVHEMQFLNEDQSWSLLQENVYGHKRCSIEFEDTGRKIARNCKGLPLAIVVTAGLLKFNNTRDYWEQVARNTDEKVTTSNDHLFEILSWSYTRLPPYLKACFLYMGSFKEDYEIPTAELVRLWVAEGFLKPKQSRSMEEVAEECLEELVERSLVLVTKKWYDGKIRTCNVHDVIREVSLRKAEEEKFHHHFTSSSAESNFRNVLAVQRRVNITDCSIANFPLDTVGVVTHSLIDQAEYSPRKIQIVQCFKLLSVLYRVRLETVSQLSSILCTLTNLRYLDFVCKEVGDKPILVPKSISELQNLETIIASTPQSWQTISLVFPLEIWNLRRLRHIVVKKRSRFRVPIPHHCCPSLQTLYGLANMSVTKSVAERFPNLKKLKLIYTKDGQNYTMENLQHLHQLEELSFICDEHYHGNDDGLRPTKFVFPDNLKKLSLYWTKIPLENLSPIGLLPNLKVLKLKRGSVKGDEWEPKEGEFLQLEHLKMECLPIRHWGAEGIHFPCLKKLVILQCLLLSEVPESIGEMDTLEMLIVEVSEIYKVEGEAKRSVLKIKHNQQEMGNDLLQVIIIVNTYPFVWKMYA